MRAWAVVETGQPLQHIDLPTPVPTGGQVLLEVTHAGVCHSDLHIWEGAYDLGSRGTMNLADRGLTLPLAMGHEIVGRVVSWGPDAKGMAVGQRRLVFPWVGCGTCARCLAEEDNLCLKGRSIGVFQHGGYASHVLVPETRHLVEIEGLDPALACTYACSGVTVYSAINKLGPLDPDEAVVLVGAGGLGLQAIAVLKAMGHRRICTVDVAEDKLAAARAAGATDTVLAGTDTAAKIIAACGGPVMSIIDLVNGTATARAAFDALQKGGRLIMVGLFGGGLDIPLPLMPIKALTLQGSYVGNPRELRALVKIAQSGALPAIPIAEEPMDHANSALNRLKAGQVTGRIVLVN